MSSRIHWLPAVLSFLTAFSPVFAASLSAADVSSQPAPMGKLVDLGGYQLHIHATGQSQPAVVLIAGAGDYALDWALVQPAVSRFTTVCSYDRAGLAWSDPGPVPRTMRQEAFELRLLLHKAGLEAPYILVGHSIGGLIARVFAEQYRNEVAGLVLVDSTHEDTTLMYEGKLMRVRDRASTRAIPPVQSMESSPPKPPTDEDRQQAEFNAQLFGPPKIRPPFDQLPPKMQETRLWMMTHPKLAAASDDFWPEELQEMFVTRSQNLHPFGDLPLVVILPADRIEPPPPNIPADEWRRIIAEKRRQKAGLTDLSRNSLLIEAEKSGHHIHLEQPDLVVRAIQRVVEAVRTRKELREVD